MIISFYGASGSGKSTLIKKLVQSEHFGSKHIAIHHEDNFLLLNTAKKMFGESLFRKYNRRRMSVRYEKKRASIFSILVVLFYPVIIYLEFGFIYIYYSLIFKKRILFCDRYIYDYIITLKDNLGIDNKINTWFMKNFPRPDILFFLDIDIATSFKRNKSRSRFSIMAKENFHKKVISDYRLIARDKKMLTINTNGSTSYALSRVSSHIENRKKLSGVREIIICGLDGVGKTTVCNLLRSYCQSFNISCGVVHFYHSNILLKFLRKIGLRKKKKLDAGLFKMRRAESKKRRERHPTINLTLALLHFMDSYIQYIFFRIIYSNSLLIYDRYFYDYLVSFQYYNVKGWQNFESFIPKTENNFLILGSPLVAYKRKPEASRAFYDFGDKAYIEMVKGKNFKIIQASKKKPNEILEEVIANLET